MSIEFLSEEALEDMTGYKQSAKQSQFLRENGIPHLVRPIDGKVRVREKDLDSRLRAGTNDGFSEPDYAAL